MARKSKTEKKPLLREETLQGVLAVLFFVAGMTLIFSALDKAGDGGRVIYAWLTDFVGVGFYLLPILAFFICAGFLRALRGLFPVKKTVGAFVLFLSGLGIIELIFPTEGGVLGNILASPLVGVFEIYISLVILAACFVIALLVMFEASIPIDAIRSWWQERRGKKDNTKVTGFGANESVRDEESEGFSVDDEVAVAPTEDIEKRKDKRGKNGGEDVAVASSKVPERWSPRAYTPPSLTLLEVDRGKPGVGDIKANANIIKRTLQNFVRS